MKRVRSISINSEINSNSKPLQSMEINPVAGVKSLAES